MRLLRFIYFLPIRLDAEQKAKYRRPPRLGVETNQQEQHERSRILTYSRLHPIIAAQLFHGSRGRLAHFGSIGDEAPVFQLADVHGYGIGLIDEGPVHSPVGAL